MQNITVRGDNTRHMIKSCFKSVGGALPQTLPQVGRAVPSTKGVL